VRLSIVLIVTALFAISCVEMQKNYGRWGQVECSYAYVCDDDGLCCTRCVNLDDGEPLMRCHDLTPSDEVKDALGF